MPLNLAPSLDMAGHHSYSVSHNIIVGKAVTLNHNSEVYIIFMGKYPFVTVLITNH